MPTPLANRRVTETALPPIGRAQAWIKAYDGRFGPVLDVAQAVPSYPPPESLRRHLAGRVLEVDTAFYTPIAGLHALRQSLADHMNRDYAAKITTDQVTITPGCNQAFCVAVSALAGPGDAVILPRPHYFNHHMWLTMQGIDVLPLDIAENAAGVPDPAALDGLITPRTRAIALVTPNNPTGAEYPPAVIAAFYEKAKAAGITLILDETYKDFRQADGPAHDLFSRSGWDQSLVQLYSFSKSYSLTGYRVGSLITGAPLQAEIAKLLDCLAICAPRIGQQAALFGLTELEDWRHARRADMAARVDALRRALAHPGLTYRLVSSGAFFAWLRHPFDGQDATAVARRLAETFGVQCLPGDAFGADQDHYLRFAFANLEADRMADLAERLIVSQSMP